MSCPTSIVPGLDESSKIKDPALEMKIKQGLEKTKSPIKHIYEETKSFRIPKHPKTRRDPGDPTAYLTQYNGKDFQIKQNETGWVVSQKDTDNYGNSTWEWWDTFGQKWFALENIAKRSQ